MTLILIGPRGDYNNYLCVIKSQHDHDGDGEDNDDEGPLDIDDLIGMNVLFFRRERDNGAAITHTYNGPRIIAHTRTKKKL